VFVLRSLEDPEDISWHWRLVATIRAPKNHALAVILWCEELVLSVMPTSQRCDPTIALPPQHGFGR
jgi:hypothetical protein